MDTFQTQVKREFDQLRAEVTTLRAALVAATPTSRPRARLPDPEKFAGSSYKFDTWLPSIRAKLRVDGTVIGNATAQFYYVYLNLDSSVQAMVLPQLSHAESTQEWDYNTILDQLARVYDNPNKQSEAEDKLYSLRQGNDPLPVYIAKFERTLYEAGGQSWPDVNKISSFRNGLNSAIRSRLAQQLVLPRVYSDFLRTVQQLSSKTAAPPYQTTPKIASDPMDVSELTIGTITSPSQAESIRSDYRKTGQCFRCGSYDHRVKDCPGKQVTITAVNDDDSGTYSDSDDDKDLEDRPDIDWRKGITTGVWK